MLPVIVPPVFWGMSASTYSVDGDDHDDDDENGWVAKADKFEGLRQTNRNST